MTGTDQFLVGVIFTILAIAALLTCWKANRLKQKALEQNSTSRSYSYSTSSQSGSRSSSRANEPPAVDGTNDLEAGRVYRSVFPPEANLNVARHGRLPPTLLDGAIDEINITSPSKGDSTYGATDSHPKAHPSNSISDAIDPKTPRSSYDSAFSKRALYTNSPRERTPLSPWSGNSSLRAKANAMFPSDEDSSTDSDDEGNARALSCLEAAGAPTKASPPEASRKVIYRRSCDDIRPSIAVVLGTILESPAKSPDRTAAATPMTATAWHRSLPSRVNGPPPARASIVKSRLERLRLVCEEHAAREGYLLDGVETNTDAG